MDISSTKWIYIYIYIYPFSRTYIHLVELGNKKIAKLVTAILFKMKTGIKRKPHHSIMPKTKNQVLNPVLN